nr:hypothetical protein E2R29_24395 [Burkholderia pseudomallei]
MKRSGGEPACCGRLRLMEISTNSRRVGAQAAASCRAAHFFDSLPATRRPHDAAPPGRAYPANARRARKNATRGRRSARPRKKTPRA